MILKELILSRKLFGHIKYVSYLTYSYCNTNKLDYLKDNHDLYNKEHFDLQIPLKKVCFICCFFKY